MSRPRTRRGKGRAERWEGGGGVESQGKAEDKGLGGRSNKGNKERPNAWQRDKQGGRHVRKREAVSERKRKR